jgi:hypothetical protein
VGEHGSESDITDGSDTLDRSVELIVNDNSSSLVLLNTDVLESETLGDGSSTDSD